MFRLIGVLLCLTASAYADGFGFCNCPPGVVVYINGTNYSESIPLATTSDGGVTWLISGSIVTPTFDFSLNVTTHPDTDVDFETSISGDPTVAIIITQAYVGGPLFQLDTQSSGVITDLDHDGHASAGSPFIQTTFVNNILADQQNIGCDITSTPGFVADCPTLTTHSIVQQFGQPGSGLFPPHGVLEMDIGFTLSDGDKLVLNGSATLTPVPEPAMAIPLVAALSAFGVVAWRRRARA